MVKRYTGGLISSNSALTTISITSGFFGTSQQLQASKEGLWPQANNNINSSSGTTFTSTRQIIDGQVIQYKYHLFLATSTFTCTGNGIVDVICVGGGGGGGGGNILTANFGNTGINNITRPAVPNTGGGGESGLRWSTVTNPGGSGGSGFVAIRYKI
jgi:hypothetical protein